MSEIAFTKVGLPYGWLGNMAPYPIEYDGRMWRTTEALFQALRFTDKGIQEKIRDQKSPMAAKMVAKAGRDQMTVKPLGPEDLGNMVLCLKLKLATHIQLKVLLLATGEARIIEDCTNRPQGTGLFWGAAKKDGVWVGENKLGVLWEQERA